MYVADEEGDAHGKKTCQRRRKYSQAKEWPLGRGRCTVGRSPVTEKAIYKNVLGKTQVEVKKKLRAVIEKDSALPSKAEQYTLGQWLDTWMEDYTLQVRASSWKTRQGFIENHVKPALGEIPLEKLKAMDLQRM